MVKKILLGVGFILLPLFLYAEVDLDASLSGILITTGGSESDFTSSGLAKGELTIKSKGSKNVKSQLTLDFVSMRNMAQISIAKAWVKFRYPLLRATIGKNRITWGDGVAFNAGDVIFDDYKSPDSDTTEELDLNADELKSINRSMALVTFPLGRFTFADIIYLPYDFFTLTEQQNAFLGNMPEEKGIDEHSFGGRFVTRAGGIKIETGYLYNGFEELHKPYISFNGTLLVDYHLSASINIDQNDTYFESWKKSLKVSAGEFYLFELEDDKTLTLRMEYMIKPFGYWEVRESSIDKKDYGLMLYPEVAYVPNEEVSLFLRSLVSVIDLSAKTTLGLNWKTYQGFSIGTFISVNLGEVDDIYSWDGNDSLAFTVMVTHKF